MMTTIIISLMKVIPANALFSPLQPHTTASEENRNFVSTPNVGPITDGEMLTCVRLRYSENSKSMADFSLSAFSNSCFSVSISASRLSS